MVKNYKRTPIQIGHDTVVVLHVLTGTSHIEDWWLQDIDKVSEAEYELFEKSAKQFIDQLEENYCDAFLMHLMKVCYDKLKESDKLFRKDSSYQSAPEALKMLKDDNS